MCGRYVTPEVAEAERNLMVHWLEYERSFNVAPSQRVPVVRWFGHARQALHMRWGLVPYFARGVPPKFSTINAAIEKLETAACWRGPWQRAQRCLIVASGFYEWHVLADGSKRPYYISCADQAVFALAGLWDSSRAADGTEVVSCTIITLPANALMADIHNARQRMPAILSEQDRETWLHGSLSEASATLKAYDADAMVAHPVSSRVNTPKNNDAALLQGLTTAA
ncbi:MAG TPA: SOS response-associated peptidase [Steroidobacteraceae bacterium]|nr:SOS response-associated peptidase [Steroidobacteraceae bacterium]